MAIKDILIKKRNGSNWDIFYPFSVAKNIKTADDSDVQTKLNTIYDKVATTTEDGAMSKEDKVTLNAIKSRVDEVLGGNASSGSFVPAKEIADDTRYLRNDNTWQTLTPGKINAVSKNGDILKGIYTFVNNVPSINLKIPTTLDIWEQGIELQSYDGKNIGGVKIKGTDSSINNIGFYIGNSNEPVFNIENNKILFKQKEIYSELNKPIPNEIGALGINDIAKSAKKLAVPVTINGIEFDGTKNIEIPMKSEDFVGDLNFKKNNAKIMYKSQNLISLYEGIRLHGASFTADGTVILANNSIDKEIRKSYEPEFLDVILGGGNGITMFTSITNTRNNDYIKFTSNNDLVNIDGIEPKNKSEIPALTLIGSKNNYSTGIYFEDANKYFLINTNNKTSGIYSNNTYEWGFSNGSLKYGTVPWENITNIPTSFKPALHSHNEYIVKTSSVTEFYAGTTVPNNNDGKPNGTVYLKYND